MSAKTKTKSLECRKCGVLMVTTPVAGKVSKKTRIEWDESRRPTGLCPRCKRKAAAESLAEIPIIW